MELQHLERWTHKSEKYFNIEIAKWKMGGETIFNIYVYVFENHPLYKKINEENADSYLDFHHGTTYYREQKTKSFMGVYSSKIIGNDYNHYNDDKYFNYSKEGIHPNVLCDAKHLYNQMNKYFDNGEEDV